jgi:hypothetical protein
MNLPIRALYEIRAFSRPATRVDWRTCKRNEARIIHIHIGLSKLGKKMWPALENKLLSDEVEQVVGLLTNYADAKVAADEATKVNRETSSQNWDAYRAAGAEWRKRDLAHRGAKTQFIIGVHGLAYYGRLMGYNPVGC